LSILELDRVKVTAQFDDEMRRFQRFCSAILAQKDEVPTLPKIDLRKFARYILQEGSSEERWDLLSCLKGQLFLENEEVYTLN